MPEFPNGQTQFKPKDKEKKRRESKSLKMMKSKEDMWTLRRKLTNKSLDRLSLIRLINNSMITKIWLRPFIAKCFYVMSQPNNKPRENLNKEKKPSTQKLMYSGKNSRNKKWPSMTKDLERSLKKNTTKR
jgi:hypothetical protein